MRYLLAIALPFLLSPGCQPAGDGDVLAQFSDIQVIETAMPTERSSGPVDAWTDVIEGQYVVRVDDAAAEDALWARGAVDVRQPPGLALGRGAHVLTFSASGDRDAVLAEVGVLDSVRWVEPLVQVRAAATPNDPYFSFQWTLAALDADTAWDESDGTDVVVAVVDTGVSPGTDGLNAVLPGYDYVDGDGDAADENGHGTHVAGTIAQTTDNGTGVAGMAPGAVILPVRVLDGDGIGTSVGLAAGILWAADNGAQIINMSLSANSPSTVVQEACAYAEDAGVLLVAATGNDGFTDFIAYPAAYTSTVAVGAVDLASEVAHYSNQGEGIDVVGPGGDLSADRNGDGYPDGILQETRFAGYYSYYMMAGTSMAAPHVSGTAALLVASGIEDLDSLRTALTTTAQDLGDPGLDNVYGEGLVQPTAALDFEGLDEPFPFPLVNLDAFPAGPGRAVLRWFTWVPSTTYAEGDNGWVFEDQTLQRRHHALVRGYPNSTVTFDVSSVAEDGYEAVDSIEVEFLVPGNAT